VACPNARSGGQSSKGYACHYLYDPSSCRVVTTYHGPNCVIASGCVVSHTFNDYSLSLPTKIVSVGGVETAVPDNSSCRSVHEVLEKNSSLNKSFEEGVYLRNVNCFSDDYCMDSSESPVNTFCLTANNSLGLPIRLVDRSSSNPRELFCDDKLSQTKGDYWCPEGYLYQDTLGVCYKDTEFCDQGFYGHLQFGCDTPFSPKDDSLFSAYQNDCVFRKAVPSGVTAYDSVCCLDTIFNGFQIWREEPDFAHVKVY
jgi:hypothetical protein